MSLIVPLDHSYPFAEGPAWGAAQWRPMASVWSADGVVRNYGDGLHFHGWSDSEAVVIGGGACWVNGFYGEMTVKTLATPGNDGLIVATLDPYVQAVRLEYMPGIHDHYQDASHYWQIPLWDLTGPASVTDRRNWIPPAPPPPAVTEIPNWVPRPFTSITVGPESVHVGVGNVLVSYFGYEATFRAGRAYRVTASLAPSGGARIGGATGVAVRSRLSLWVADDRGLRATAGLVEIGLALFGAAVALPGASTSVTVENVSAGAVAYIAAEMMNGEGLDTFYANSCTITANDAGEGPR